MPAQTQRFRKTRKYRNRRFRGKKALTKRQALAVRSIATRSINARAEKKYYDRSLSGTTYDWSGSIVSLTNIAQGSTDVTRDGDSIYLRSCRVVGDITAGDTTNMFRVIIFQWFDDTTPVYTDILSSVYQGTVNCVNSPYHHDQRKHFNVMYDKRYLLDSSDPNVMFDTKYMRPAKRKVHFSAGGTTGSNELFILFMSDSGAATHPSVNFVARTTFNDM